jgi:hypothetical protein
VTAGRVLGRPRSVAALCAVVCPLLLVSIAAGLVPMARDADAETLKGSDKDKSIVAAGLIAASDVPGGWMSKAQAKGDPYKGLRACNRQRSAAQDASRNARVGRSPQFLDPASAGQATYVASTVYVFKTSKPAGHFLDTFRLASVARCIQAELDQSAGTTTGVGPAAVSPIVNLPAVGDDRVGYEATVPLTSGDQTALLYLDTVEVRAGRALVGFVFVSLGQPNPLLGDLLGPVTSRVAQAGA